VAVLLLVLAFSAAGVASQCAGTGCLYLTPGISGGAVYAAWRNPGIAPSDGEDAVVAVSEGAFELVAAGKFYPEEPPEYTGELVAGPYEFAP
jgi:hypothetical protein